MTLEAKEYEFDNVIEDVKKVRKIFFEKFPIIFGRLEAIDLIMDDLTGQGLNRSDGLAIF